MSLFQVPGWSMPTAPVSLPQKKRKRPIVQDIDEDKIQSAKVNLDKLMQTLSGVASQEDKQGSKKKKSKQERITREVVTRTTSHGREMIPYPGNRAKGSTGLRNKIMQKKRPQSDAVKPPLSKRQQATDEIAGLTNLQKGMKHSLDGARFRWINELLYKSDSSEAVRIMKEDPTVYHDYHTGFRHQMQSWPSNPVTHYISQLSSYPQYTVIADLGCGDAALARGLSPKKLIVLSFDLISDGAYIVEADICSSIPLPGSEPSSSQKSEGEAQLVDVVVCALSLMGTNWPCCIREAWRILKPGGELKIAEITSRFLNVDDFVSLICSVGFKMKAKDDRNSHITLFEFKKIARRIKTDQDWSRAMSKGGILKPCEYKRR